MATRTQNKRAARRPAPRQEFNPRALLLAGVGAVSLGRKQAIRTIDEAGGNVAALRKRVDASVKSLETRARKLTREAEGDFVRLRKQAEGKVAQLRKQARGKVAELRKQASTQIVAPLQHKLDEVVVGIAAQAETRFGPVLAKLGVKPARKPAARRPAKTARKSSRKAA
jgi:dsDNA-specific endonuclease/ATPase MutS2